MTSRMLVAHCPDHAPAGARRLDDHAGAPCSTCGRNARYATLWTDAPTPELERASGHCEGCGATIIDPVDIEAGWHITENGPGVENVWRYDHAADDYVLHREPIDPRQQCGPVKPGPRPDTDA